MTLSTQIKTRRDKRKEIRKKRKRNDKRSIEESSSTIRSSKENKPRFNRQQLKSETSNDKKLGENRILEYFPNEKVRKGGGNNIQENGSDSMLYLNHHALTQAIQSDEAEIAELEKRLGLTGGYKHKEKLYKEYSKLEGFGHDFGEFLDDLDDLVDRVRTTEKCPERRKGIDETQVSEDDEHQFLMKMPKKKVRERDLEFTETIRENQDDGISYAHIDPALADALRRDDEEILGLEKKLGLSKRKEKEKLYKEYSNLEGYGEDFGDFLDDLDSMLARIQQTGGGNQFAVSRNDSGSSNFYSDGRCEDKSEDEELLSFNGLSDELDKNDSAVEELARMRYEEKRVADNTEEGQEDDKIISIESSSGSSSDGSYDDDDLELDLDNADTYQPSVGEDIYGNNIDSESSGDKSASKYVPPHLRGKQKITVDDKEYRDSKRIILRSLNNCLNRLSEETLISVAQQVAKLYSSNPTPIVHELLWKSAKNVCIATPVLMVGLIPLFTACITGVHIQTGDTVQIGENILENAAVDLLDRLKVARGDNSHDTDDEQKEIENKQIGNSILFLGYLYNYGIVHCSFIYDVIRHLIKHFSEADVECLLLLLSHCGRSLRSDDPMALKDIILLVQKKKSKNDSQSLSSRTEYMVSAITDLKKNKRKREDVVFIEKIAKFKKILGKIKSSEARSGVSKKKSEASLKISLDDIMQAETKGRWWKVGASWVGNQYRFSEDSKQRIERPDDDTLISLASKVENGDEELLKLATKFRMNTDRKRTIFCIIIGGTDCEDTFEKLCRSSMLQNRTERDTIRVLMECCGKEKSYNKFYGHLAARVCEYQPQSKFSLQLAYWDIFKQFDTIGARKGANLAKLLFHLVVTHKVLKFFPVIKTIDLSDDAMDEVSLIFLTIVLTSIIEHFENPLQAKAIFSRRALNAENESGCEDADEGVRAGLLIFFMETLKASPKNKKNSRFRKNFKAIVKELDINF